MYDIEMCYMKYIWIEGTVAIMYMDHITHYRNIIMHSNTQVTQHN